MTDYTDLYVMTTEELPPWETNFNETVIRLYCRTAEEEPVTVTVTGYKPYFYIRRSEATAKNEIDYENVVRFEETEYLALEERYDTDPEPLTRVIAKHPGIVSELRRDFEKTWAADTIFTERFRIDSGIRTGVRVPDDTETTDGRFVVAYEQIQPADVSGIDPRVVTLDIETDDRAAGFPAPGDARILSVVLHDSYEGDYTAFLDLDGRSIEEHFGLSEAPESLADLGLTEIDALDYYPSERQMLIAVASWIGERDPDLICGWNSGDEAKDGFDLPHLIERMAEVGAEPARLSRDGSVQQRNGRVEIGGRSCYDLMDGWEDTKFTKPRSKRLDYVANLELADAKIEHPDMGYYEMYREDPAKFLNYNGKDVRLVVEINEKSNVLGFKKRLKDMVGVDWFRTHQNNEFVEMSIRRKCREHGLAMITAWSNEYVIEALESDDDDVNYEGAYVFPAFTGVKENCAGVDLASLYPMTQWMLNASPDTKISRKRAFREDIPHVVAANKVAFRTDEDSIIRELVDDYHQLKAEFKAKRNAATYGTDKWDEMAEAYNVTKTIYNSFYGYTGWDRSPLYDPEIAAAVTLTGQVVIKRTAEYMSDNTVAEVVYGDTDSNYVTMPSAMNQAEALEELHDICETLTTEVYPDLCERFMIPRADNRWEIEVEMFAKRMFMHGKKKRYAYLKTWDEGDDFDEVVGTDLSVTDLEDSAGVDEHGKFSVTGYECVKSNYSLLTKETQEDILELIVRGAEDETIAQRLFEAAGRIDSENTDWEYIGIPQGLGKNIDPERADDDEHYSWSTTGNHPRDEGPRAAWFSNHLLNVEYKKGSKPMRAKVKPTHSVEGEPIDVIAYESERDLATNDTQFRVDTAEMQRKTLENPMSAIFEAIGLSADAALTGKTQSQTGLEAFL